MAPSACFVAAIFIMALALVSTEMEVDFRQGEVETPNDEVEIMRKRASNLGSRMCRLDSRNCGAFNMGKKFGGYSWLRSADSTRRRLEYFLANKWQRGENTPNQLFDRGDEYWQAGYNN